MESKMKMLEISNEQDRLAVAMVLLKNGYTVRQSKYKNLAMKNSMYVLMYGKGDIPPTKEEEKE